MRAFFSLLMTLTALFTLSACSGDQGDTKSQTQSRVVEETEMPESWEQRQYAATEDPDRGAESRQDMERAEDSLRRAGEDLRSAGEHGMDAAEKAMDRR